MLLTITVWRRLFQQHEQSPLKNDGQQFHQYQQHEQSPLNSDGQQHEQSPRRLFMLLTITV
jgi:hypothetical protein